MRFHLPVRCFGAVVLLALAACSPQDSAPAASESSSAVPAAPAPPATNAVACSSPDVASTLEGLVWESVEQTVAEELARDRAADVAGAAKANVKISFQGVATVPGQNGARPTCEATIVGSAAQDINPDSNWLQKAMRMDEGIKVRGRDLVGNLEYTAQPADDGKPFRVSARGVDTYALALAGVGLSFSMAQVQAKWEADQRAKSAPSPAPARVAAPSAPDQQADVSSELEAADKALNAAYQAARAPMTDAQKNTLRDEQRAWIKKRDAECSEAKITADTKGDVAGGSAMALEVVGCKTRLTEARTKELRALASKG